MLLDDQIAQFLRKAEADEAAMLLLASGTRIDGAIVGFHAQQSVEKRLKALLCFRKVYFPRTHDIQTLLDAVSQSGMAVPDEIEAAAELTPFAVTLRYDDIADESDLPEIRRLIALTASVREWIYRNMPR